MKENDPRRKLWGGRQKEKEMVSVDEYKQTLSR